MKEVLPQESMNLVVIIEVNFAPLKMINPVAAGILEICRKTLFYPAGSNCAHEGTWGAQVTDISFKIFGHKPQAALG